MESIEIWSPASSADLFLNHGDFGLSHTSLRLATCRTLQKQPTWTRISHTRAWRTDCASWAHGSWTPCRRGVSDVIFDHATVPHGSERRKINSSAGIGQLSVFTSDNGTTITNCAWLKAETIPMSATAGTTILTTSPQWQRCLFTPEDLSTRANALVKPDYGTQRRDSLAGGIPQGPQVLPRPGGPRMIDSHKGSLSSEVDTQATTSVPTPSQPPPQLADA